MFALFAKDTFLFENGLVLLTFWKNVQKKNNGFLSRIIHFKADYLNSYQLTIFNVFFVINYTINYILLQFIIVVLFYKINNI